MKEDELFNLADSIKITALFRLSRCAKIKKDIMKLWQGNGAIGRVYKPGEKASCYRI
jgi:hypothetical protein